MTPVFTLHHFAGTGGTIISRMIGGIDRVCILSEVHPDRHFGVASNPLFQFQAAYPGLVTPPVRAKMDQIFVQEIDLLRRTCEADNRILVVRDHYHRDIIDRNNLQSRTFNLLRKNMEVRPIYTVRNPMDTWASFKLHSWNRAAPGLDALTVEDFMHRFVAALKYFEDLGAHIFSYEAFVEQTDAVMNKVAEFLGVSGGDGEYLGVIDKRSHYTGASGRTRLDRISRPPTRWGMLSDTELRFFARNEACQTFCATFGMELIPDFGNAPPRIKHALEGLL